MKDYFEASAIKTINKVFSGSVFTGRKFHFRPCLWRQPQNIGLTVEYKEVKQVRLTCRMRAALAYLPINTAEENMFLNMKILHGIRY
jgi:hypothetical protein